MLRTKLQGNKSHLLRKRW